MNEHIKQRLVGFGVIGALAALITPYWLNKAPSMPALGPTIPAATATDDRSVVIALYPPQPIGPTTPSVQPAPDSVNTTVTENSKTESVTEKAPTASPIAVDTLPPPVSFQAGTAPPVTPAPTTSPRTETVRATPPPTAPAPRREAPRTETVRATPTPRSNQVPATQNPSRARPTPPPARVAQQPPRPPSRVELPPVQLISRPTSAQSSVQLISRPEGHTDR